jgi:hypothetical protein
VATAGTREAGIRIALIATALILIGIGEAAAQEIILYDNRSLGGRSLTLHGSAPDLDQYNWDNDVDSIRVISGTWEIYRDDNYGHHNGPSFVLSPGDYPDISHNPGFPRNRMSSVRLVEANGSNNGNNGNGNTQNCPSPYHVLTSDGRCVWSCAPSTQPGSSGECVCQQGLVESGQDQFGRRVCSEPSDCPGPYHVQTNDGRCVWSCGTGTQPGASGECVCQQGLVETDQDQFGRRVCGPAGQQQAEIILYDNRNFGGRSLTLHGSAPDLDHYNWDNDVDSIRVISGNWEIYRDDNYGHHNGPSFVLSPGDYPDISHNPGFPRNRMSSVQLK